MATITNKRTTQFQILVPNYLPFPSLSHHLGYFEPDCIKSGLSEFKGCSSVRPAYGFLGYAGDLLRWELFRNEILNYYLIKANWIMVAEEELICRSNIGYVKGIYAYDTNFFRRETDFWYTAAVDLERYRSLRNKWINR